MKFFYALFKRNGSLFSFSAKKEKRFGPTFTFSTDRKVKKTSSNKKLPYSPPKNDKLLQSKIADLVKNFNTIYPGLEPEVELAWNSAPPFRISFFKKLQSFFSRSKTPAFSG
jgi:hypothetical protein